MRDGVAIIIPAYNEERNIKPAVESAIAAVKPLHIGYEIIVVDDGSTDRTGEIIDTLSRKNSHVKGEHHQYNMGMGAAYRTGIARVTMPYVTWFPGDNDTSGGSLQNLIKERKSADIIASYSQNPQARSWARRIISKAFVITVNLLFGLNLKYYNGCSITATKLLTSIPLYSNGFTAFAEEKVRLLKKGCTVKEIPFVHIGRKHGTSKAVAFPSILSTLYTLYVLLRDVWLPDGMRKEHR